MIIITNEIMDLVQDNNAFIVLVKSISKRASYDNNQSCFPSLNTMAKDCNLSKPTIIKALKYLQETNIIKIHKRQKKGSKENYSNVYYINTSLIKVIGNLKVETPVKEFDQGSKGDLPPSKGDLPPLVKEIDCNHKTNLNLKINKPVNIDFSEKKLSLFEKIKEQPLYLKAKQKEFPLLTDDDIKFELEKMKLHYKKDPTFIQAINWLKRTNQDKKKNNPETPQLTDNSFLDEYFK